MAIESIAVGPELAKALVAAHAEIHNPKTDCENSYFNSRYTSLGACRNVSVPVLAKHGVTLMQDVTTTKIADLDGQMIWGTECRTLLVHESGQALLFGPLTLPAKEGTAQALGSAQTYSRRYSLCAVTSIAPTEDDDDANAATGNASTSVSTATPPKQIPDSVVAPGLPLRPLGNFAYGKKYVNVPWAVMDTSDLIWFRDAERTPPIIREKCKAELAWRDHEGQKLDEARRAQQNEDTRSLEDIDKDIPF